MHKIKQIVLMLILIQFSIILFSSQLSAQEKYSRRISISEWIEEMENCKDDVYQLFNTEIFYNYEDSIWNWSKPLTKPTEIDNNSKRIITARVMMVNCKLPTNLAFQVRNVVFENNVCFANCKGAGQVTFYNCTFKQGMEFISCDLEIVRFNRSSILQRTVILSTQMKQLLYRDCSFYTENKIVKSNYTIGYEIADQNFQYLFYISQGSNVINDFLFVDCKLMPTDVTPILLFLGGKYDNFHMEGLDFANAVYNFNGCSIKENFTVKNCKFNKPFGMEKFIFPKDNTSFLWCQLDSLGIGYYTGYNLEPYTNKTDSLITDVSSFNELNNSYRKFFSMYKTQGDMESANACYIQLKDMETTKYRYLYNQDKNINSWFNWRFNQFLKHFSAYGTNPIKSLIFSMWTILVFAGVYFFFYSSWDGINRGFLIKKHRTLMQYFNSEQRLEDFYTESYVDDLKEFDEYKKEMRESKLHIPLFIVLIGRPLYLFSVVKYKFFSFIYRRTEILHGKWTDLKPMRKVFVGTTVFFSVLIYIIYLGVIRALNSTTLSINSFSTLGFGTIPVKGASRYITILEGFLGWFLLSIFSVSLISQMIQN